MISKYRVMRGLLKRKFMRDIVWKLLSLKDKGDFNKYESYLKGNFKNTQFDVNYDDISKIVSDIRSDGACKSPKLPKKYLDYFVNFTKENPCFIDRDPGKGFFIKNLDYVKELLGKEVVLAQYFNVNEDAMAKELSEDPFIQSVACKYLKSTPKLMSVNMWWTFPSNPTEEEKSKHAHVFHYDLDDVKFVKFFYYLTDVDETSGPHVYVKSSNEVIKYKNSFVKSKRFADEEIESLYGIENIVTVTGEKGTGLIEDTITLHKGITPKLKPRLMLQLEYAINRYQELSCECLPEDQTLID